MHDDLTAQDIEMMQKELDHRKLELMPELIAQGGVSPSSHSLIRL